MKIMFSADAVKHNILRSIYSSLQAIGEDVIIWTYQQSVFDAIDIQKPDIIFITNTNITRDVLLALNQNPGVKIILYSTTLPQAVITACNPDLILIPPGMPEHVEANILHENKLTLNYAADVINYNDGYYMDKAKSDILVIADRTTALDTIALQQINGILALKNLSVKCIGYRINTPLYVGQTDHIHTSCFMKSTKLVICYSVDMLLNCVINRAFCLTPHEQDWVPQFTDESGLLEGIDTFIEADKQKRSLMKKANKKVLATDTCFHRLMEISNALDITEWSDKAQTTLSRYIK